MITVSRQGLLSPFHIGELEFKSRIFKISGDGIEANLSARAAKKYGFLCGGNIGMVSENDILKLPAIYATEAKEARREGYRVGVVHGGTGTFLGNFISPGKNSRTDRWGGCLENRMRLPLAILDKIHEAVGGFLAIEFCMSGAEFLPDGYTVEEGIEIAKLLDKKTDILYVAAGVDLSKDLFIGEYPSVGLLHGSNIRLAAEIKKNVDAFVATTGGLDDPKMMNDIIASGKADILYSDAVL